MMNNYELSKLLKEDTPKTRRKLEKWLLNDYIDRLEDDNYPQALRKNKK